MTQDEFVKVVRKGSGTLRVDDITLRTGEREARGKGLLTINSDSLKLRMVLDDGQVAPNCKPGVYTESDCWQLTGTIEDFIPFNCEVHGTSPGMSIQWDKRRQNLTFDLNQIELVPTGWDALTLQQREQLDQQLHEMNRNVEVKDVPKTDSQPNQNSKRHVYFYARIANYPLPTSLGKATETITKNPYFGESSGWRLDTIMGDIRHHEFAFIKESDGADLEIYIKSKEGFQSSNEDEDWDYFYGIMRSLSFVLGVHAWPYQIQYWRNGPRIVNRITPTRHLAKTVHAPFHMQNFDFQDVIRRASEFFGSKSALSKEVAEILFLFREAADFEFVHGDITVLTSCVLFESLVNQLFKGLNLEEKSLRENADLELCKVAKTEIAAQIKEFISIKGKGYERLYNVVSHMQLFTVREKLQAVANHFGLEWQGDMEDVFKTWQKARDPLVHGKGRANLSEADRKDLMLAESRIAGAINILVLKTVGYSGKMSASVFEGKYRQI